MALASVREGDSARNMSKEEQEMFVVFFNTFKLSRNVISFTDLYDGKVLFEVMAAVDSAHFKNSVTRAGNSTASTSDNWVLKMNTMKRLYRLLLSYSLPAPHSSLSKSTLREPDFTSIGKGNNKAGLLQVCRMCLVAGVWSPSNEQIIGKIQSLKETQQRILMTVIEEIMGTLPTESGSLPKSSSEKSDLAELASESAAQRTERDRLAAENDDLRLTCETLRLDLAKVQTSLDETTSEKEDALERLATSRAESALGLKLSQGDGTRSELVTMREELGKAEEALQLTEVDLEKQTNLVGELTKTVEELRVKAAESRRLKDQLDEFRHTAERLKKSENVIEKYKKKLEDTAELRREFKSSEEHNARLTNANATLEAEIKKLGSQKSMVETYRAQVTELERKHDEHSAEVAELNASLEAARSHIEVLVAQSEKDHEELQLSQDRVKELELSGKHKGSSSSVDVSGTLGDEMEGMSLLQDDSLDEATKTDLKLRIRSLLRELEAARSSSIEGDRVGALEEQLADANRAKERYQNEYLDIHRTRLVLQSSLDEIRAAKGNVNDAQVSVALRQQLSEVVEELDTLRRQHQELQVVYETMEKDYSVAKSDLSLVDNDQLEALHSLRESLKVDKETMEMDNENLKSELASSRDKTQMQLEQINGLLMDKVQFQSVALERMVSGTSEDLSKPSEESQERRRRLSEDNAKLGEDVKLLGNKLAKAREFIKEQDALLKLKSGDQAHSTAIADLQQDLIRTKRATQLLEQRYKLEQQLILTAWHDLGARTVREHLAHATNKRNQPKPAPTGWLTQQRQKMGSAIFVSSCRRKVDNSRDR